MLYTYIDICYVMLVYSVFIYIDLSIYCIISISFSVISIYLMVFISI